MSKEYPAIDATESETATSVRSIPNVSRDAIRRPVEQSYTRIAQAVRAAQTRLLIYTHCESQIEAFHQTDISPPRLLLRAPGGGPFEADLRVVMQVKSVLGELVATEREKIARLLSSTALVDPVDVEDLPEASNDTAPTEDDYGVVANPDAGHRR